MYLSKLPRECTRGFVRGIVRGVFNKRHVTVTLCAIWNSNKFYFFGSIRVKKVIALPVKNYKQRHIMHVLVPQALSTMEEGKCQVGGASESQC